MTKLQLSPLSSSLTALAAVAALLAGSCARADEAYNNSVRLGSYSVFYHTSADDIAGPYVPPGVNLQAENVVTLYGAYVRTLSSRFDVEFTVGWPPLVSTKGVGPAKLGSVPYNGEIVASARWIAPSLLVEYKFLSANSMFRPYIGVGTTFVTFYDREFTAEGQAAAGGPTKLSLTNSIGPSATVGIAGHIAGHWHAYASYSVSRVETDLTANTEGVIRTTHISFGPQALVLSVGYSF